MEVILPIMILAIELWKEESIVVSNRKLHLLLVWCKAMAKMTNKETL